MRIFISVDMEGISGVTRWADVVLRGQDYQRARHWMTADVNAAVSGARAAGATEFVVEENHGTEMLCNLLLDEIDPELKVRGVERELHSMLGNLVGNAVRYSPNGGEITVRNMPGKGCVFVIDVPLVAAETAPQSAS